MQAPGLSYEEFRHVCDIMQSIRITHCPPEFDFKALLVARLQDRGPGLAEKVAGLNDEQVQALCLQVMERQKLERWMRQ